LLPVLNSCTKQKSQENQVWGLENGAQSNGAQACGSGFGPQADLIFSYMIKKYRQDPLKVDRIKAYIYDSLVYLRNKAPAVNPSTMMTRHCLRYEQASGREIYKLNSATLRTEYRVYLRPVSDKAFDEIISPLLKDSQLRSKITNVIVPSPGTVQSDKTLLRRDIVIIGINLSDKPNSNKYLFSTIRNITLGRVVNEAPIVGALLAPGVFVLPSSHIDMQTDPMASLGRRIYSIIDGHASLEDKQIVDTIKEHVNRSYVAATCSALL